MKQFRLSNSAWKMLITALSTLAILFVVCDVPNTVTALMEGTRGTLGAKFNTNRQIKIRTIESMQTDSPLSAVGAVPGDKVILDTTNILAIRYFKLGESVGLTLMHDGQSRHVVVNTISEPIPHIQELEHNNETLQNAFAQIGGRLGNGVA